jgi:hypothetical protein
MKSTQKTSRKIIKALKITAITIAVIIISIRVAIPIAGVVVANKVLPEILGTDAGIRLINMVLFRGRVAVRGIKIAQPDGFDGPPLFSLKKVAVNVKLPTLMNDEPITIQSITIDDLCLNMIRDTNGVINISQLAQSSDTNQTASTSAPPAIIVEKISISNLAFSYTDQAYNPPLNIKIKKCDATITNIIFDVTQGAAKQLNTSIILTALIEQSGMHNAFIGITAKLGMNGTNIPAANAAVRLSGFELSSISSLVPMGVKQTLGGDCVDIYVDLAIDADILDCKAKVKTDNNTMRLTIGGTPAVPVVDKSTALGNVVTRPGAIIGGMLGDATGTGIQVVAGAGKTITAAGTGAGRIVSGIGKGLFHTAKGVATADLKGIKDGALETTVGTAKETAHTVSDTAGTAAHGVGDAASAARGKGDADAWRSGSEQRWNKLWQEAQQEVEAAPYPAP